MTIASPNLVVRKTYDERRPVPRLDAGDEAARTAVERACNWDNAFRYWHTQRMAYNLRMYRGDQWIRHFPGALRPGSAIHRYSFERIRNRSMSSHPTPVDNMIGPAVDNEVARLVKRQFVWDVKPQRHLPQYQRAAKLARDVLTHDLRQLHQAELREQWAFDLSLYGTAIGRTFWDENVFDLSPVGAPRAKICKQCKAKYASDRVPAMMAETGMEIDGVDGPMPMFHVEQAETVEYAEEERDPGRPPEIEMKVCPLCETAAQLDDYDVLPEEAEEGVDVMGRPMGELLPKGEPALEVVSPFDYYPANGGLTEPNKCWYHAQATVRDLDWIFARMPDLEGKIEPENPQELLKYHPTLGDRFFSGGQNFSSSGDRDTYPYHALVKELHAEPMPYPGFEEGRSIIVVGNEVFNDVLTVDVRTPSGKVRKIPRVMYSAARCKRIPGEFWGRTWVDDMISPQRRLNEIDAQEDDHRRRGSTRIALFNGEQIDPQQSIGSLNTLRIQTESAPNLDIRTRLWNGIQAGVTSQYHQQREIIIQSIVRLGAPTEIESGINPPGVSTATEMLHLADEAQVKREPRAAQLANMIERLFAGVLQLRWAFQAGRAEYERDVGTKSERQAYRGVDLVDEHVVRLEQTTNTKSTAFEIAAAKEAYSMGLVDTTSALTREKMLDVLHIRKDLNEDTSIQIERAESTWIAFAHALKHPESEVGGDHTLVPPIDQNLDAHKLWYSILGQRWQEEDGQELQARLGWEQILPVVNGPWELKLAEAEMMDPLQRQTYEKAPPEQWQAIYDEGKAYRDQAVADDKAAQAQGLPPGQIPPMPQPPNPQLGFLPGSKDQRILWIWVQEGLDVQHPLVQMRARIEAHRLLSEAQERELMAGQAPAPAPGAGSSGSDPQASAMPAGMEGAGP